MSKDQFKLDIAMAIDEFEEENVYKNLRLLVQDYYHYYRSEIEYAKRAHDTIKMKIAVHNLKSTSRYLCCEYFALKCQNIEDIIKNAWDEIDKVYDEYLLCFEWLYEDAKYKYETIFNKKLETEEKIEDKKDDSSAPITTDTQINNINTLNSDKQKPIQVNETILEKDEKEEKDENDECYSFRNQDNLMTKKSSSDKLVSKSNPFKKKKSSTIYNSQIKNAVLTEDEFKELFKIDVNEIKIKVNEIDSKLRNFLKELVSEKMIIINSDFKKCVNDMNKEEFIKCIENLRITTSNCRFDKLSLILTDIKKILSNVNNLHELNYKFEIFSPILDTINSEANRILQEYRDKIDEEGLNKLFPKNRTESTKNKEVIHNNSPLINKAILSDFKIKNKEEDNIFNELKPVKFDGLYKIEITPEKIEEEILKLTQQEVITIKPKKNIRINSSNDTAYPFKQDTRCLII